jgi:hypothetical protein
MVVLPFGAWVLRPVFGVNEFAAEVCLELLGMRALGEAEDVDVHVVAAEEVAAAAE